MIVLENPPLNDETRPAWANWFQKVFLLLAEQKATNKVALLASTQIDMQTVQSNTIYTTRAGVKTYVNYVLVRDPSDSLAGGTDYDITNFRQTVNLSSLTATTDYIFLDGNATKYSVISGGTDVELVVNTGSTAAATAYIDVFGYEA